MNRQPEAKKTEHSFSVKARKNAQISGVTQVVSFDESCVVLLTECGEMTIEGNSLAVDALDVESGQVSVSGEVSAVLYADERPKRRKGFFGRRE